MGEGASMGREAVLADSGWAGEIAAGVERVRNLAFLNILRAISIPAAILRSGVPGVQNSFSIAW